MPFKSLFSFAQDIAGLLASTCVTFAPAFAAKSVATPVYANKFNTFIGLRLSEDELLGDWVTTLDVELIFSFIHFHCHSCSGKTPVCLKGVNFNQNFRLSISICHLSGI